MQTLNNIPIDNVLTRYFKPIYEAYSVKDLPRFMDIDRRMRRLLNIVHKKAGKPLLNGSNESLKLVSSKFSNNKQAYIAFSGGKDCLATAIRAKQDGYAVTLCYISGINKSLPSERKHAQDVAKAAGFSFVELKITISGNKEYNEHPLKNILILCLLIDAGIKHGVTAYGIGNTFDDDSIYGSLDYDLSDSYDLLKAFSYFMRGIMPEFKWIHYVSNTKESFYTVWKYNKSLIPLLSTCITPDYRRPMIRKANIAKYGADLLNRDGCGSCYKCAFEYQMKQSFGMVRLSKPYYQRCLEAQKHFDRNYVADFKFDKHKYNQYGGKNIEDVQVLCDRCGYYIGQLKLDKMLYKYFTHKYFGGKHYQDRDKAEKVCLKFKKIYKL